MIPVELSNILISTPGTLSGVVRFVNTRVPVAALIDTLDEDDGLETILEGWPFVLREHAQAVIHWQQNFARETFGHELMSQ